MAAVGVPGEGGEIVPSTHEPGDGSDLLRIDMNKALDDLAKRRGLSSRSRALEAALSYWLAEQERRRVEEEVEAYYRGRTSPEKREDREWAEFASRSARHLEADE